MSSRGLQLGRDCLLLPLLCVYVQGQDQGQGGRAHGRHETSAISADGHARGAATDSATASVAPRRDLPIDTNQDGRFDAIVLDTTRDGRPDTMIPTTPGPMPVATVAGFLCSPPTTHLSQDPPPYGLPVMQCI